MYTATPAVEQSAAMAERFHRIFPRTLCDLRRRIGRVAVQRAGRVNVGSQQAPGRLLQTDSLSHGDSPNGPVSSKSRGFPSPLRGHC